MSESTADINKEPTGKEVRSIRAEINKGGPRNRGKKLKEVARRINRDPMVPELLNRRAFDEELGRQIESARRQNSVFSLLIIDLDDMKPANDIYGHPVGDKLIKEAVKIIRSEIRISDVGARVGGDEFAIILPGATAENSFIVAEKIREAVKAKLLTSMAQAMPERENPLTISIGSSAFPSLARSQNELFSQADIALYCSKQDSNGNRVKNRSTVFVQGMVKPNNNNH